MGHGLGHDWLVTGAPKHVSDRTGVAVQRSDVRWTWTLGENPEPPKANRPVRKFSQGGRWLRENCLNQAAILRQEAKNRVGTPSTARGATGLDRLGRLVLESIIRWTAMAGTPAGWPRLEGIARNPGASFASLSPIPASQPEAHF